MRTPHSRLDWPNPRVPLLSRGNTYSSGCGASGRLPGVSRLAVLVSLQSIRGQPELSRCVDLISLFEASSVLPSLAANRG